MTTEQTNEPLGSDESLSKQWGTLAFFSDLGFVSDYEKVWNLQKTLVGKRVDNEIPDIVLMVEHDHVLTSGRSAHAENILLKELPHFEIERGGDVTYHGPGQLVVYPIVSLQARSLGVRSYVQKLEAVIIDALSSLGITNSEGKLGSLTGVWISNARKIASIGVATTHWVTYHGVALNVNTDLTYFQKIKPCGFESSIMTSVSKELGVESVDMNEVKNRVTKAFSLEFGFVFESKHFDF
ncbi:MAG: lipoyl(octanoyl) transferase LipB [Nitrososphaerales archaeon]